MNYKTQRWVERHKKNPFEKDTYLEWCKIFYDGLKPTLLFSLDKLLPRT